MNLSGELVLRNSASRMFLRAVGIEANPFTEMESFLLACQQANPRYKNGKDLVRFELEDEALWPQDVHDATLNLAGFLNMCRGETPLTGAWDIIIALGGARRSPLHRACYAAQAVVDVRATVSVAIAVAGSTRLLNDAEKAQVQDFAPGAETEYDLCYGAAEKVKTHYPELNVVSICKDDAKSGNDGVIDQTIEVLDPETAEHKPLRVAAVTTRIYTVGLHLDMAKAAKRHSWRDYAAAGHASDPETVFNRKTATYLSECLTTLRKAAIAHAEGC